MNARDLTPNPLAAAREVAERISTYHAQIKDLTDKKNADIALLRELISFVQQVLNEQQVVPRDLSISTLSDLDDHVKKCLSAFKLLGEIADMTEREIQQFPNLGGNGLEQIRKALVSRGLNFTIH